MIGKIVHYAPHAKHWMRLRGITMSEVSVILAFGQRNPTGSKPGRAPRAVATALLHGRVARVVYTENERRILVLSVHWVREAGEAT